MCGSEYSILKNLLICDLKSFLNKKINKSSKKLVQIQYG